MAGSMLVGLSGIFVAWLVYYRKAISAEKLGQMFGPLYLLSYNKWWFDELYDYIIIRPTMATARFFWSFDARVIDGLVNGSAWFTVVWSDMKQLFDQHVVDGAVNGAGWLVRQTGQVLRFLQTGGVQFYALFIVLMIVVLGMSRLWPGDWWPLVALVFLCGALLLGLAARPSDEETANPELAESEK